MMPSDLARRIRAAVLKSLSARNRYTDQVTTQLTRSLDQAEKEVAKAILKYRTLGSLPDNKLGGLKGPGKAPGRAVRHHQKAQKRPDPSL
jgi:hypothetical protein